jgi:hypothetical protein
MIALAASVIILAATYNTYEYNIDTHMIHMIHRQTSFIIMSNKRQTSCVGARHLAPGAACTLAGTFAATTSVKHPFWGRDRTPYPHSEEPWAGSMPFFSAIRDPIWRTRAHSTRWRTPNRVQGAANRPSVRRSRTAISSQTPIEMIWLGDSMI